MHKAIKSIIRSHIAEAVSRVDPTRYRQEPSYVNAVLARIDGLVYKGIHGEIELKSTVVDDRGPNSAESKYGADFAITAVVTDGNNRVEKAIIGQAKKGRIEELSGNEAQRLRSQVEKMRAHTDQHVVLEVPEISGTSPRIRIPYQDRLSRPKYFTIESKGPGSHYATPPASSIWSGRPGRSASPQFPRMPGPDDHRLTKRARRNGPGSHYSVMLPG